MVQKAPSLHQNHQFRIQNQKKFWGGAQRHPSQIHPPVGGDTLSPPPSSSHIRRSNSAFTELFF